MLFLRCDHIVELAEIRVESNRIYAADLVGFRCEFGHRAREITRVSHEVASSSELIDRIRKYFRVLLQSFAERFAFAFDSAQIHLRALSRFPSDLHEVLEALRFVADYR